MFRYVYVVVRLFVTVRLCSRSSSEDVNYFELSQIRFVCNDRANVACAIPRFASSATTSFGASALVLDCCRCPSL